MTAVNMQLMPTGMPLDFMPIHPSHSRSNSVSSTSTHSSNSRPQSSQGGLSRMHLGMPPSAEDLYGPTTSYHLAHHGQSMQNDHSPPNHNITNPALKGHLRPSHIRARAAASPYPRETDSVHSSSSEADDISMYLGNPGPDYHNMYAGGHPLPPNQETLHTTGAFGRMTLSPDHALEKLAANVRAATTTSASDRAKQIFVQAWLTANYATYPDGNVPRQGLYFSYRRVCEQYGIPHINTATLGKAIRLCFPTIKTRRLGVRGNSKYHYCGIRPATSAEAEWLQEYIQKSNNNAAQNSINAARLANEQDPSNGNGEGRSDEDDDEDSEGNASAMGSKRNSLTLANEGKNPVFSGDMSEKTPTAATLLSQVQAAQRPPGSFPPQASIRRHPQGEPTLTVQSHSPPTGQPVPYLPSQQSVSVRQLPHFPSIDEAVGANSTSPHGMAGREVWGWFQDHLDALLESVRAFRFDQFEMHLRTFWTNLVGHHREVVHAPAIAGLMAKADAIVFDEILEILRSQMLSPIPSASLTSLRQLANKMEKILLVALEGYGNTFVEPKVELGARFGHLVLRYLDIYQVTQALNTVLTNQKQLADMRRSWQKVDFESVRNQSALVCNCRHEDLVQLLEVEFVAMLDSLAKTTEPVREVMAWADKCCERLMGGSRTLHNGEDRSTMSSRSVLIRWGYVTSQVMRDLTIRSDPAFGAFQILKLFLDDWIAVNVLRSVALSTNSVAASVEPMMQQQYFSLSPMAGQETFGSMDVRPTGLMAHTPTTSSMLAALQQDSFPGTSLDPTSTAFGSDAYGSLSYMDATGPQEDSLPSVHGPGLGFSDFPGAGGSFDVGGFTPQDLAMNSSATPGPAGNESDHDADPVKAEQSTGV
ncbi:hypothetical protein BDN72DRAFT_355892 [Pluteus cervinus]|uniref:Uncharacterized protein n=1 Tax=Pluteus cervinus TaxID=181527 RepID=A0ACD3BE24_9AGAR|nr:hypothetical protein BDN72DRAFT_355892 [Pluteus cervinus]